MTGSLKAQPFVKVIEGLMEALKKEGLGVLFEITYLRVQLSAPGIHQMFELFH